MAATGVSAAVMVGALGAASPALAKGITSATITGPGLDDPIDAGNDIPDLSALTHVWEVSPGHPDAIPLADEPPTPDVGPAYLVTWRIMTGPSETTPLQQVLYPHAAGGPLVDTPAGQRLHGGEIAGGWHRADARLARTLMALGVPGGGAAADSAWPGVTAGTVAVALAAFGGLAALVVRRARRREGRERVAAVPL
jgi:hypothetical protein